MARRILRVAFVLLWAPALALGQAPVSYRLSFPEPEHRSMQIRIRFDDLPPGPLELRMSRSSPGRYAVHDFAKNVYDVRFADGRGAALRAIHPRPHEWNVIGHTGSVEVTYRIFGDRVDGTYSCGRGASRRGRWRSGFFLRPERPGGSRRSSFPAPTRSRTRRPISST